MIGRRVLYGLIAVLVLVAGSEPLQAGQNPNPQGFLQNSAWNLLFPLTNPSGCDGGGTANMARNWVAPHDLGTEAPGIVDIWSDIDFQGAAAAAGYEAQHYWNTEAATWFDVATIETAAPGAPTGDGLDFGGLVEHLNSALPANSIRNIAATNVLGIAQTYILNSNAQVECVTMRVRFSDSMQIWVNQQRVMNVSRCGAFGANDEAEVLIQLDPGVNKITLLHWQGTGDWRSEMSFESQSPNVGLLSNLNSASTGIVFQGSQPDGTLVTDQLRVSRTVGNPDACPVSGLIPVTLKGNGNGSGTVSVVEGYLVPLVFDDRPPKFSNLSPAGTVEVFDLQTFDLWILTFNVSASVLNSTGVSYDVEMSPGIALPILGAFDDCSPTEGDAEIIGGFATTGPIGVFDDSHHIGLPDDFNDPLGQFGQSSGGDGQNGTIDDIYTIEGSGTGIGADGDSFHFGYKRLAGDFSARVRIIDRKYPSAGGRRGRYGLMARLDCTADSQFSMVHANLEADPGVNGDHERGDAVFWFFRQLHKVADTVDDLQNYSFPDPNAGDEPNQPAYFRLDRRGKQLIGYASNDGTDWKRIGSNTWYGLDSDAELLVGFAYTKDDSAQDPGEVVFTELTCGPLPPAEIFDNDDGGAGTVLSQESFNNIADGKLPNGYVANTVNQVFVPQVIDGRLRLSEEGKKFDGAAVFLPVTLPAGTGQIIVEYTAYFTHTGVTGQPVTGNPNPGDGMTFMLIAGENRGNVGGLGNDLGYGGITRSFDDAAPSLAVESDSYAGTSRYEGTGSPNNDGTWHLGINAGGSVDSVVLNTVPLPDIFAPEGVRHRVVINSEGKVTVFVRPGDSPAAGGGAELEEVMVAEGEVEPVDASGETDAVIAFGAGTGSATQTTEVDDVAVTTVPCSDTQEVARIREVRRDGDCVTLSGFASDAGAGDEDEDESLTYEWELVSGGGEIVGPTDGLEATVCFVVGDGDAVMRLRVDDHRCSNSDPRTLSVAPLPSGARVLPGDVNHDGKLDISDPVRQLNFLFGGGELPECFVVPGSTPVELAPIGFQVLNFNGDMQSDISDAAAALNFLFSSTGAPHALGEDCVVLEGGCSNACAE